MQEPSANVPSLRIGEVAAETGAPVATIRYYEQIGLLPAAERTRSGYRRFTAETVRRLRFIRRAQELGFSLDEIRELLELRATPTGSDSDTVRLRTEAKLEELKSKIADLRAMHGTLKRLHTACCEGSATSACPILDALDR